MSADRQLAELLRALKPVQRPGAFVFVVVGDAAAAREIDDVLTSIVKPEGAALVVPQSRADRCGLAYEFVGAWITLQVHSALDAVGLTAAVSTALATSGIPCKVLAGFHHDHLLVPSDRAQDALGILEELSRGTA